MARHRRHDACPHVLAAVIIGMPEGVLRVRERPAGLLVRDIQAMVFECLQERHLNVAVVLLNGPGDVFRLPRAQLFVDRDAVEPELVRRAETHPEHLPRPRAPALVEEAGLFQRGRLRRPRGKTSRNNAKTNKQNRRAHATSSLLRARTYRGVFAAENQEHSRPEPPGPWSDRVVTPGPPFA